MIEYNYANVFNGYGGLGFFFKTLWQVWIFFYYGQAHQQLI